MASHRTRRRERGTQRHTPRHTQNRFCRPAEMGTQRRADGLPTATAVKTLETRQLCASDRMYEWVSICSCNETSRNRGGTMLLTTATRTDLITLRRETGSSHEHHVQWWVLGVGRGSQERLWGASGILFVNLALPISLYKRVVS